ncbi:MAG: glycosyltransferase family 2 protein [Magnetococcales bacterium]|nr:glycosyltransferase family 2 protein [Magnetococcales bacterium]
MNSDPMELTLLMPCLNEANSIEVCVRKGVAALERLNIHGEVLIADNGSSDGSQKIAIAAGARVIDVPIRGYGSALMAGIEHARGRYIIMADADDSYDWSVIDPFVEKLRQGTELVMGCRLPKGGGTILPGAMPPLHRWLGNPVLSWIGRLFFGCPVQDFHCGMRGFSKERIQSLGLTTPGMEFASEMVIKATLARLRIEQTPITLHPDQRGRPPHLKTWRDGWRHLRFMMILSPNWVFLVPGLFLFLLGLVGFFLILPGTLWIGDIGLDVNTLLVSGLMCIIGFQCISFWALGRVFVSRKGIHPDDPLLTPLFRFIRLETGLMAGFATVVAGLALLLFGVHNWADVSFGNLEPTAALRIVIPAVTMIALGVQTIFSSFLMSMLGMLRSE